MYCVKCGSKLTAGALFCTNCGTPVVGFSTPNTKGKEKELTRGRSAISEVFMILSVVLMFVFALTALVSGGKAGSYSDDAEMLHFLHERRDPDFDYYFQTGKMKLSDPYMDSEWNEVKSEYYSLLGTAHRLKSLSHFCVFLLCVSILLLLFYFYSSKMQIIVTDKRVFGKAAFGKRVDLPLDKISAVVQSMFHGLTITTSGGKVTFVGIKERDEVHKVIIDLLMERYNRPAPATQVKQAAARSKADVFF